MLTWVIRIMGALPPLHARKSPLLAGLIGFVTSGLGLVLYFRSLVDLIVLGSLAVVILWVLDDSEFFAGMLIGALYGYLRVFSSNRRLDQQKSAGI